ncbi:MULTISPECIES: flavin reductase family protein [Chryseobacterium]|uniref:Flavin reductase (DIM6/NTAB) family NADH-FMN oxidoreductase RutF n=1 Tax=Chryseobacterium camelliae TaxID=1265445 RepID=A0ABU0TKF8_9FLAO|nr:MULTISPECIES: flavin reductase family protein [Chryseobacterium]MDT3408882.1 flavin reductase (DIM6/NTAB) family NADH-FMN oxidoreductase RutF [Pseudacidovorax intermedius]MDQ1097261.1 flavin reductase (DIM6/NTAB) family NADH-FMN oxidoreductase RutF [Chryseobacterium camelliae]MDQ1101195.1 flavin reductase (DIM6/NTAB) family NADH-FMN oxidoreductase RutF [Chryseobacterium sp. SORGH_AS_1048]MDR6084641.1 flavin reductase (DIM6/NTAB) family NADH-FMN oxidoreductase RutF [Chryseobacterium sp. SORGH
MKTVIPSELSPVQLQTIMQTAVSPRPIALASTVDRNGNSNLSPFSFFNMFSTVPPVLIFSPSRRVRDNTTKHTLENILEVAEVVIGTVNFPIVQQISLASTEYETGVNEFVKSGLTMKDADLVQPKLIEECPVNFECTVLEVKSLGEQGGAGNLVICEVQKIHIREEYLNAEGNLDQKRLDMVARLGGNWYSRNNENNLFEVPKPLVTKGIGFDLLPDDIKYSRVFTGNDLGMLANIEQLPGVSFYADEDIHREAKNLLLKNNIEEAWKLLTQEE